jgi:DNA-binding GntR family transcriptional regulator
MNKTPIIHRNLIRTQVYEYIRKQLITGKMQPGSIIGVKQLKKTLGVSQTPLREAFLQLQADGFVTVLPNRGIEIKKLSRQDIENIYEILGALDSRVLFSVFKKIGNKEIERMKEINKQMVSTAASGNFHKHWELNTIFHGIYINLSQNYEIQNHINILRQRLFEFGKFGWKDKFTKRTYGEHLKIIAMIEKGKAKDTADFIQEVHLSSNIDELKFISANDFFNG